MCSLFFSPKLRLLLNKLSLQLDDSNRSRFDISKVVDPFHADYIYNKYNWIKRVNKRSFQDEMYRKYQKYNQVFYLGSVNQNSREAIMTNSFARFSIFKVLPSFISFLFRIFYITKSKFDDFLHSSSNFLNEDLYFSSVYRRFLLFWRAIIFFKCFKKTVNLPDCLIFINPDNQQAPFNDFSGVNVPVISVADSNSYTDRITYLIPSNDDSLILLLFYFLLFLNACDSAMSSRYVHFF